MWLDNNDLRQVNLRFNTETDCRGTGNKTDRQYFNKLFVIMWVLLEYQNIQIVQMLRPYEPIIQLLNLSRVAAKCSNTKSPIDFWP